MDLPHASADDALRAYLRELEQAVHYAQQTRTSLPFKRGTFIVLARGKELEIAIKNVTEEDAILIASELKARGVHVSIHGTVRCPHCQQQVPRQSRCLVCRHKLV